MKTGADTLGTAENESGRAKHEKGPVDTAEHEFGSAKSEIGIRRSRYRRKRVRACKT
jgi:hypothetical protein